MSYTKQNFSNGQVLTADHMNKIDEALSREALQFGDETVFYLPETNLTFMSMEEMEGLYVTQIETVYPFVDGDIYVVNYNGKEYSCKCNLELGGIGNIGVLSGGDDTGEPFVIATGTTPYMIISLQSDINVTLSITGTKAIPISVKYIPEEAIYPDTIDLTAYGMESLPTATEKRVSVSYSDWEIVKRALRKGRVWLKLLLNGNESYVLSNVVNKLYSLEGELTQYRLLTPIDVLPTLTSSTKSAGIFLEFEFNYDIITAQTVIINSN